MRASISARMKKSPTSSHKANDATANAPSGATFQFSLIESTPPSASEITGGRSDLPAFLETIVKLERAAALFSLSRTSFFRFRRKHGIATLPGRKVSLALVVAGFEAERRVVSTTTVRSLEDILAYRDKLLTLPEAAKSIGCSPTTFWRFRVRAGLKLLPGGNIHADDVTSALKRLSRRCGNLRQASV